MGRPVKAYIIFNRDEDFELCDKYLVNEVNGKTKAKFEFEGQILKLKEAPEPSEIVW